MQSTREVLRSLRGANPGAVVTEERIRRALRAEKVAPPSVLAGRLAWFPADVQRLAEALGLNVPEAERDGQALTNSVSTRDVDGVPSTDRASVSE